MIHVGDGLADRFTAFCESLPLAERIDTLPLTGEQRASKKADFFFANRQVICEIKTLENEPDEKVVKVLLTAGITLPEGQHSIRSILRNRPDERELHRRCINAAAKSVADALAEANRQVRETKKHFNIADADGLLILLHGRAQVLNPDVIMTRLSQRLAKKVANDRPAHEHISLILLFSEVHKLRHSNGELVAAVIAKPHDAVPERFGVGAFARALHEGWAKWNNRQMY